MLDRWQYAWNKFNDLVLEDFCDERIDEQEMERRLDRGESTKSAQRLVKYAKELGYTIKIPKQSFGW